MNLELGQRLAAEALQTAGSGDMKVARTALHDLKTNYPFLYSLVGDTIGAAAATAKGGRSIELFHKVAEERIRSLENWSQEGNETVDAINRGQIDAEAIKPHNRQESAVYERFYADQSARIAARHAAPAETPLKNELDSIGFNELPKNINHSFRWMHAISLIEQVFGITNLLGDGNDTIRWMDIGCGTGNFANKVNPAKFGVKNWDIVGCDLQEGKIQVANRNKTKGRRFFPSDAFDMLDSYKTRGETFHLVSMFEFLEHLDDPLKFIRRLDTFRPKFVLAASPLEQKFRKPKDTKPDRVHFWSYSRQGWQQMFELAGFEVVYSSETRVGSYIGGLDWLTMLCGPRAELQARRQELGDFDPD